MTGQLDLDLFAGVGGWEEAQRAIDPDRRVVGIESDREAVRAAELAGHERRRADVSALNPAEYRGKVRRIKGSPPCQGFSSSGLKGGHDDLQMILDLLDCTADGEDHRVDFLFHWQDAKSALMVEPLRWVLGTGAGELALEQVPSVLPIWEEYAAHLQALGWWADFGVLRAVDFGVPQDRERAILVASAWKPVRLPLPTVERPVPASTVLGPGTHGFPRRNDRDDGGDYRARDIRSNDLPSFTVTEKARSWTLLPEVGEPRQITVDEAARLQSFRSGYPWQGPRSRQFLQVANAIPPAMAEAVLRVFD